jgi:hypothetical protein
VVKVILVLYVAFSSLSLKSSPMLSMLLSVEELVSVVIPYCHVFENQHHTSFPLLPQLSFNFFLLSSSHDSNPSSYRHHRRPSRPCRCLIFYSFAFTFRTEHLLKHPSRLKFMKLSFQRAIIRMKRVPTRELCLFYSGDAICPKLISGWSTKPRPKTEVQ